MPRNSGFFGGSTKSERFQPQERRWNRIVHALCPRLIQRPVHGRILLRSERSHTGTEILQTSSRLGVFHDQIAKTSIECTGKESILLKSRHKAGTGVEVTNNFRLLGRIVHARRGWFPVFARMTLPRIPRELQRACFALQGSSLGFPMGICMPKRWFQLSGHTVRR